MENAHAFGFVSVCRRGEGEGALCVCVSGSKFSSSPIRIQIVSDHALPTALSLCCHFVIGARADFGVAPCFG